MLLHIYGATNAVKQIPVYNMLNGFLRKEKVLLMIRGHGSQNENWWKHQKISSCCVKLSTECAKHSTESEQLGKILTENDDIRKVYCKNGTIVPRQLTDEQKQRRIDI